jgi:Flp pilus assembly protein TadD
MMKKFAKAIKAYAKAAELQPDDVATRINTARCYHELKDYENALLAAGSAEEIAGATGEVQKMLGDIHGSRKDYDQAVSHYKRALELDSNNPEIMTALAATYLRIGENESAKELLTAVVQLKPDEPTAHQYLGFCHLRLGQIDEAIAGYRRAIALDDRDWEAHRGLGVAYMMMAISNDDESLKDKAVAQWRLSLAIKPDQPRRKKLLKLMQRYSEKEHVLAE